jgi:hypothetical protein
MGDHSYCEIVAIAWSMWEYRNQIENNYLLYTHDAWVTQEFQSVRCKYLATNISSVGRSSNGISDLLGDYEVYNVIWLNIIALAAKQAPQRGAWYFRMQLMWLRN